MSTTITIELYNKLCPDYPLDGQGEWGDVQNYVRDIDSEMKRKCYWLGDCHHYNLSLYLKNYIEYWPNQGENYQELNKPRGTYLKRAIDSFTTQLYDLKLIG